MEPDELYVSLGLAIAAGLLIGIERELSAPRDSADGSFLGGAHASAGGPGCRPLDAGLRETGWPMVVAAFASLILFLVVNFFDDVRRGAGAPDSFASKGTPSPFPTFRGNRY